MITQAQVQQYKTEGFLVIKNFASNHECRTMRERAAWLVENSSSVVDPRAIFDSQTKGNRLVSYSYFLESTNKISLFFEKSAVDSDGRMLRGCLENPA